MDATTESSAIMDIMPEFLAVLNIAPESYHGGPLDFETGFQFGRHIADVGENSCHVCGGIKSGCLRGSPTINCTPCNSDGHSVCVWVLYASSVSPEVATPDLVLPEAVTSAYDLSASSPICELPACPVTTTVITCELPVCLGMTTEVVPELPVCQDMTTVVIPKLSLSFHDYGGHS